MRALWIIIAVSFFGLGAVAKSIDTVGKDTLSTNTPNKQVLKLNVKLAKLQVDLATVQSRIPDDEDKVKTTASDSQRALEESRDKSAGAVGGDAADAKRAAKAARKAARATKDAEKAVQKLQDDRDKIKKLNGLIEEIKGKISQLQQ